MAERRLIVHCHNESVTRVFDEESGKDITPDCAHIDHIPALGYKWKIYKRSSATHIAMTSGGFYKEGNDLAHEFGEVIRVEPNTLWRKDDDGIDEV